VSFRKYETEASMCEDIILYARQAGFTAYPECGKWDLLLVRRGIQIGVQVKLRFTHHLVSQALDGLPLRESGRQIMKGPHYRAIACQPARTVKYDAYHISRACHLLFLDLNNHPTCWLIRRWAGYYYRNTGKIDWRYYRWRPQKTLWLPPAVPNLPAGVPSPSIVGPWQVAACRLEQLCRLNGSVARADALDVIKLVEAKYNPGSLLQRFYQCTKIRDPRNPKARLWELHPRRRPASREYPRAWEIL